MNLNCYSIHKQVEFSECEYFGKLSNFNILCWFENIRFAIARSSGIEKYFFPEHRSDKGVKEQGRQYFLMPVLKSYLKVYEEITIGCEVIVHAWIDKPIGSFLLFHYAITDVSCEKVFIRAEVSNGLVNSSNKIVTKMPEELEKMIIHFIDNIKENSHFYELELKDEYI